ncbi:hypothetical protein LEP1GSC193_4439 [Leptospira alstonii serovar Pingchang str. 80-412]|uniref:Uncharacterized protein n=2 Tax=Leptospira alstonii TaxID=28452 RepID=M6CQ94_9LEPT|nr:hypothetical protein LEP1GSC194_2918 [Leptospira alstonii serovar Sichuan str. 79601]EQA80305.1 hypothetical protein LEP1GSC193_4439 [Leptospira alstonii serovar Pingchang str. 80-412]
MQKILIFFRMVFHNPSYARSLDEVREKLNRIRYDKGIILPKAWIKNTKKSQL